MATDKEFIVNKKFLIVFVTIQLIVTGLILYALLSPKSVTVHVEKVNQSYQIDKPLEIVLPDLNS